MAKAEFTQIDKTALLKKHPETLRALHNGFGIDWKKPHTVARITGSTTPPAIRRALDEIGYKGSAAVIIVDFPSDHWRNDRHYAVELDSAGDYTVDNERMRYHQTHARAGYGYSAIDHFCRKSDYNDARKTEGTDFYIVAQKDEDKSATYRPGLKLETGTRYRISRNCDLIRYDGNRDAERLWRFDRAEIDGSGYWTGGQRAELKRRARALKAERDKGRAAAYNYAAEITEISNRAETVRARFAALISSGTLEEAAAALNWESAIRWGIRTAAHYISHARSRDFTSPAKAAWNLDDARKDLEKAEKKLDELEAERQNATSAA